MKRHLMSPPPYPGFTDTAVAPERAVTITPGPVAAALGGSVLTESGEIPVGFMPHEAENRRTRRAAVATWEATETQKKAAAEAGGAGIPSRRELLKQRQRQRRGTLDIELRRLQKRKADR